MATIRTNENMVYLRLEVGEGTIVEFQPEGANAHRGSPVVSFEVGTFALPGGRMALTICFPKANHFVDERGVVFLLDNPSGASELLFDELHGPPLRVRKPSSQTTEDDLTAQSAVVPEGLPELLEMLADRLFCRSGEKDYYDQQLIKQARRATWELRTIKHQHWLSQFEEIRLRDSQYIDPSSEKH